MASQRTTLLTIAGVATVAAVGYAVYFDQKRRSDANFRRQLKKDRKRVTKTAKLAASESGSAAPAEHDFEAALEEIRKQPTPATPAESEQYFLENVSTGEQLQARGPLFYFPAAIAFFRALRVYPAPTELIGIYQQTVSPPVFMLIVELMNHDVKDKAEGYYKHWPPKAMGVEVGELPLNKDGVPVKDEPGKPVVRRRGLVARKDFAAGEVIYKEQPVAATLDLDLEGKGTHCSNCLRELEPLVSIPVANDPLGTTYCSKACQLASFSTSHNVLFGNKTINLQPDENILSPAAEEERQKKRRQAQEAFAAHVKTTGKLSPLLTAKFFARMISNEIAKVLPSDSAPPPPNDLPEADDGAQHAFYDHMDRLRFLEVTEGEAEGLETTLLKDMLDGAMPGLEEFIKDDRYLMLKGKILFNTIGVAYSGGRLNKPKSGERFESWDLTRTPYGTSRQTGSAFYRVSSYLAHSCAPSARPSFPKGTAELHLVANRDIKAGEELTMSYVRSTRTEGETAQDNRRTRRQELARGWRFVCECSKCAEEAELAVQEVAAILAEAAAAPVAEVPAAPIAEPEPEPVVVVEAATEAVAEAAPEVVVEPTTETVVELATEGVADVTPVAVAEEAATETASEAIPETVPEVATTEE